MAVITEASDRSTRTMARVRESICDPRMRLVSDWSDLVAMRTAREVLMGLKYPDDKTRRSLYASWLRVIASDEWQDYFDTLMLECLAATPSPTHPEKPLFANIYSVRHPADGPIPDIMATMLNLDRLPALFTREREPVEPLPTSAGIVCYLADLIRKGDANRAALDEAGLIITFCCMALAVTAPEHPKDARAFFRNRLKKALVASVPTSFNGDMFIPGAVFLRQLSARISSDNGVLKPFFVLLVLGQYAYHLNAERAPSADIRFLEEGFLNKTRYINLDVIKLLLAVQEHTGLSALDINELMRSQGVPDTVIQSTVIVEGFLERAKEPMQKTRPWCLSASRSVCLGLDMRDHVDYAIRLTALVAPDPNHELWKRAEFAGVSRSVISETLLWARQFRRFARNAKNEN